jgi:hypothetical protein
MPYPRPEFARGPRPASVPNANIAEQVGMALFQFDPKQGSLKNKKSTPLCTALKCTVCKGVGGKVVFKILKNQHRLKCFDTKIIILPNIIGEKIGDFDSNYVQHLR